MVRTKKEDFYLTQRKKVDSHKTFFHYTNLNNLAHILKDRVFRLSLLEKVNDPVEEQRVDIWLKRKVFAACFSHSEKETIPMWRIYADHDMGLSLFFNDLSFFENNDLYSGISKGWEIRDAKLIDVLYDDKLEKYVESFYRLVEDSPPAYRNIGVGFIKTNDWRYEDETRVRFYVDVKQGNYSIKNREDIKPGDSIYKCPDFEYVFCKIPDETLYNMKIIFNPFMDEVQENIVKSVVKSYLPEFNDSNFVVSILKNKIRK